MKALGFTPNRNYLLKKLTQTFLIGSIIMISTIVAGRWIGHWINPSSGSTWGLIISLSINLAWLGLGTFLTLLHYRSLFYEIHEDEVIMHAGVITRSVTHVPFKMITNLKVRRGPFDRLFELGTIDIQTAGKGEYHGATESLVGLRNFKEVYDYVTTAMRQNRDLSPTFQEKADSSDSEMLRNLLHEMKGIQDLLQDHGVHQKHPG